MIPQIDIVRCGRKTIAIYVRPDGRIEVRAPKQASEAAILGFVKEKEDWIRSTREKLLLRTERREVVTLTAEEERYWRKQAGIYLAERCAYYAPLLGVTYGPIRINGAKTRWGSCSSTGSINFTWKLMFVPEELIDYVVVHELAHRKEMNHSERFWKTVEGILPDYRQRRAALREYQRSTLVRSEKEADVT